MYSIIYLRMIKWTHLQLLSRNLHKFVSYTVFILYYVVIIFKNLLVYISFSYSYHYHVFPLPNAAKLYRLYGHFWAQCAFVRACESIFFPSDRYKPFISFKETSKPPQNVFTNSNAFTGPSCLVYVEIIEIQ